MKQSKNGRLALGFCILFAAMFGSVEVTSAQNVTGYDSMPDPILFLLREPAVQFDLGLTDEQQDQLIELNDSLDDIMLGSRNKSDAKMVQQQALEITDETREAIAEFFSDDQLDRLRQIRYRIKGMSFVLDPEAALALTLTAQQRDDIKAVMEDAMAKIKKVQSREYPGDEAHRKAQKVMTAARKEEQKEILALLDNVQRKKFVELVGEPFDAGSLGQASFKAPDLIDSGEWVNTESLELSDLKGKVVALHFFAFG